MKLPKDRKNDYSREAMHRRLHYLSSLNGFRPQHLQQQKDVDPNLMRGNIENIIGFTQVPTGVIGPLKVNGSHARGDFYVPLSTTEGALIASFNRGARVISLSGGVNVAVLRDSIQRAPFFELEDLNQANEFLRWVADHFPLLQQVAQSTTRHGKLLDYSSFVQGKTVYLRLNFSTGDAMGMNMITRASHEVCQYIVNHFPVMNYALEGNLAVDKKPSYINTIMGRGKTVTAETLVLEPYIRRYLQTSAQAIANAYRQQIMGAQMSGTMGTNGHIANGMAALFLACGQDLANIAESGIGFTQVEAQEGNLYVSINIPSLIVGTVGGGVSLPTQRECLELVGCYGKGKSRKFAEIAAATALAGEISLGASLVAGDFITAHEKYGRNRPQ